MLNNRKVVFITGGSGFIGSHIANKLYSIGEYPCIIDNLYSGNLINNFVCGLKEHYQVDITNKEELFNVFRRHKGNITGVIHCAAVPRVQFSIADPILTNNVNINGTLNVLMACKEFGVKRFVLSSSSSVYGEQTVFPLKEDMKPNPLSPYAIQKLTNEKYCEFFHKVHGMETVSLRYFNVYGPGQDPTSEYSALIPKIIFNFLQDKSITIFGDGEQTRDFCYINNVVDANIKALKTEKNSVFGKVFNIGGGKSISVNEVFNSIRKHMNKMNINPIYGPAVVEARHSTADLTLSEEILEWKPLVDFDDGIVYTIEDYQRRNNQSKFNH